MENKNEIIRKNLEEQKENTNKYQLAKMGISAKTLDNWTNDRSNVNTGLVDFILAVTQDDDERLKYLKMFEKSEVEEKELYFVKKS